MHRHGVWVVLLSLLVAVQAMAVERSSATLGLPCTACHGPDGVSQAGAIPSIAGLHPEYQYDVLLEFKEGRRGSTIMQRIAKGYKGHELRKIARYFAQRPWMNQNVGGDREQVNRGHQVHEELCGECLEDDGRFQDKDVPRLAGQRSEYLLGQMELYLNGEVRLPQPTEMAEKLAETGPGDLQALSVFYANVR